MFVCVYVCVDGWVGVAMGVVEEVGACGYN